MWPKDNVQKTKLLIHWIQCGKKACLGNAWGLSFITVRFQLSGILEFHFNPTHLFWSHTFKRLMGSWLEQLFLTLDKAQWRLRAGGVHTGNGVEFRHSALGGGIEAFGLSAHLKEDFLFLQFTCELFLQSLRESRRELYSMCTYKE